MLDESLAKIVEDLVSTQLADRDRHVQDEHSRILNDMAARGLASSGGTISRVRRLCEDELQIRAPLIMEQLATVIKTVNIGPYDTLSEDLMRELERHLLPEVEKLQGVVNKVARLMFGKIENLDTSLDEARDRALKRATAQINLFVAGLKRAGDETGRQTGLTFYGPVGLVQTGPGASAHVTQIITLDDWRRLFEALERVREQVESREEVEEYSKKDLIAVIDDARSDVSKEQPNMLRLRSLCSTIATTIQTAASLRPAYELLKGALLPFGVVLP
jgi:hypothetical protein